MKKHLKSQLPLYKLVTRTTSIDIPSDIIDLFRSEEGMLEYAKTYYMEYAKLTKASHVMSCDTFLMSTGTVVGRVFNRDCRLIGIYNQLEYVLVNYFDLK
jgi:hypothetical protein